MGDTQITVSNDRNSSLDWRGGNKCFPVECIPDQEIVVDPIPTGLSPELTLGKKMLCEFVGTFIMVFGAAGTAIMNKKSDGYLGLHGLAGGAGFVVMIVIFSTGHISGAHINPAVTLAFATFRHFPFWQVPLYWLSQLTASICSAFLLRVVYTPFEHGGPTTPAGEHWQAFVFEMMLTAIMMFVVTAVATDTRAIGELAGIAVGATVYLNNLIAAPITGASMNPARTLGPAIAADNYKGIWVYFLGPFIGAQLGAGVYTLLRFKNYGPREQSFIKK